MCLALDIANRKTANPHASASVVVFGVVARLNWVNELTRADPSKVCDGVRPRS
jgi:hypothetical protein